jgi:hypothetical protein
VDRGRDLNLGRGRLWLLALLETRLNVLSVSVDVRVIHEFVESLHVDQVISLVY